MARTKRNPGEVNDQGEIIELLKQRKFYAVWERVKLIGYQEISDMDERIMVCRKAYDKFDPYKNNNFIMFYKQYLKYHSSATIDESYYKLTQNQNIIGALKTNAVSPTNNQSNIVRDINRIIRSNGNQE